ncbi:MAG: hypothetical protein GX069_03280 [Tissierellia bacterium]|nr:hypothetical protein [Tissierellia bacterium]
MDKSLNYKIVTNNPRVKENYKEVIFIDGSFEDVLLRVRDLVHKGYELISHPLGASIRVIFSPYRSIIIGKKLNEINETHVEIIESSIQSYRNLMQRRKPDTKNSEDYAFIDNELLKSSLEEFRRIYIN